MRRTYLYHEPCMRLETGLRCLYAAKGVRIMKKIFCIVGMLVCITAFAAQTVHAQQVALDAAIMSVAMELSAGMERGSRVAVVAMDAGTPAMANFLVDELNMAFIRMGFTAAGGGRPDLVAGNDAEAQAAGIQAGAQFVVTGSFTSLGDFFIFRTRLLDVESGDIRGIHTANVRPDTVTASLLGTGLVGATRVARERENRLSGERANFFSGGIGFAGGQLSGFNLSLRYERDIRDWFSFGASGFFNIGSGIDFGIAAATRFYGGPFFFGLDLGFGMQQLRWRNWASWDSSWWETRSNFGVLINPSIGLRFGGNRMGFHGSPVVSFPMVIGGRGFTWRIQPGVLLGGAW